MNLMAPDRDDRHAAVGGAERAKQIVAPWTGARCRRVAWRQVDASGALKGAGRFLGRIIAATTSREAKQERGQSLHPPTSSPSPCGIARLNVFQRDGGSA
jgi:hypothetical protein